MKTIAFGGSISETTKPSTQETPLFKPTLPPTIQFPIQSSTEGTTAPITTPEKETSTQETLLSKPTLPPTIQSPVQSSTEGTTASITTPETLPTPEPNKTLELETNPEPTSEPTSKAITQPSQPTKRFTENATTSSNKSDGSGSIFVPAITEEQTTTKKVSTTPVASTESNIWPNQTTDKAQVSSNNCVFNYINMHSLIKY